MALLKTKTEQEVIKDMQRAEAQKTIEFHLKQSDEQLDELAKHAQEMIELGATEEELDEIYDCMYDVKESIKEIKKNAVRASVTKVKINAFNTMVAVTNALSVLANDSVSSVNSRKLEKQQKDLVKRMEKIAMGTAIIKKGTAQTSGVTPKTPAQRDEMRALVKARMATSGGAVGDLSSEIDSIGS